MAARLEIADLQEPSVVHGVHGTEGISQWKAFTRRNSLRGPWEAVEWAWLPPNGISGEHVHTRTEELYFILSGTGAMTIDRQVHLVAEGDLILTGLGTRHGLRNAGHGELSWLVVEIVAPATTARAHKQRAHKQSAAPEPKGFDMSTAVVINLREQTEVDPQTVLTGPLRRVRLAQLRPGQSETLTADTQEHALFTVSGSGNAVTGSATVPLGRGVAVTLPLGGSATVSAGPQGVEIFIASLAVPATSEDPT